MVENFKDAAELFGNSVVNSTHPPGGFWVSGFVARFISSTPPWRVYLGVSSGAYPVAPWSCSDWAALCSTHGPWLMFSFHYVVLIISVLQILPRPVPKWRKLCVCIYFLKFLKAEFLSQRAQPLAKLLVVRMDGTCLHFHGCDMGGSFGPWPTLRWLIVFTYLIMNSASRKKNYFALLFCT